MITYQETIVEILRGIYGDDCIGVDMTDNDSTIDNHKSIISDLLESKINTTDIYMKIKIKHQKNYIHCWLLMKD
ncbi:MAG: hypothetical protein Ta2E_01440 [Mycoplasmoidaceae bacterium]|nr:MAG: hypothetical protein Ta2E_01440 [Mycoplasmoidaceae bacterium]